jgi:peptide-methionine (S)-S-oxide reductase
VLGRAQAQDEAFAIPPPAFDETPSDGSDIVVAVIAGGCFWGVQGVYQHVEGVLNAVSGYAGGSKHDAKYELVGNGDTGHAEAVQITYDRSKITYGKLLQVYFSVAHDPTQLNRQGPDHGPQYRSTIFPTGMQQREVAERYIAQLDAAKVFRREIVTTIEDGRTFYPAETYHQDFMVRNPSYPYIVINDAPKVRNLAELFPELYRPEPVLVMPRPRPATRRPSRSLTLRQRRSASARAPR